MMAKMEHEAIRWIMQGLISILSYLSKALLFAAFGNIKEVAPHVSQVVQLQICNVKSGECAQPLNNILRVILASVAVCGTHAVLNAFTLHTPVKTLWKWRKQPLLCIWINMSGCFGKKSVSRVSIEFCFEHFGVANWKTRDRNSQKWPKTQSTCWEEMESKEDEACAPIFDHFCAATYCNRVCIVETAGTLFITHVRKWIC